MGTAIKRPLKTCAFDICVVKFARRWGVEKRLMSRGGYRNTDNNPRCTAPKRPSAFRLLMARATAQKRATSHVIVPGLIWVP